MRPDGRTLSCTGALLLTLSLLAPGAASAAQTSAQKLFRDKLLKSGGVSREVKTRLSKGGFVDRRIGFDDLTGEGKQDAVVMVHSGGSAGRIALFVFSAGKGRNLRIVYSNQRLYRATAKARGAAVLYTVPEYASGDELCCPSKRRETTLRWNAKAKRFAVAGRREL